MRRRDPREKRHPAVDGRGAARSAFRAGANAVCVDHRLQHSRGLPIRQTPLRSPKADLPRKGSLLYSEMNAEPPQRCEIPSAKRLISPPVLCLRAKRVSVRAVTPGCCSALRQMANTSRSAAARWRTLPGSSCAGFASSGRGCPGLARYRRPALLLPYTVHHAT